MYFGILPPDRRRAVWLLKASSCSAWLHRVPSGRVVIVIEKTTRHCERVIVPMHSQKHLLVGRASPWHFGNFRATRVTKIPLSLFLLLLHTHTHARIHMHAYTHTCTHTVSFALKCSPTSSFENARWNGAISKVADTGRAEESRASVAWPDRRAALPRDTLLKQRATLKFSENLTFIRPSVSFPSPFSLYHCSFCHPDWNETVVDCNLANYFLVRVICVRAVSRSLLRKRELAMSSELYWILILD